MSSSQTSERSSVSAISHRPEESAGEHPMDRVSYVLGIVAIIATFVPPGLFVAPVLGLLAVVFGVVGLTQARRAGRPIDKAVIGIVLGAVSLATSLTGIWLFRHVIGQAIHDATTPWID